MQCTINRVFVYQIFVVLVVAFISTFLSRPAWWAAVSAVVGGLICLLPSAWFAWHLKRRCRLLFGESSSQYADVGMMATGSALVKQSSDHIEMQAKLSTTSLANANKHSSTFLVVAEGIKIGITVILFLTVAESFPHVQWIPLLSAYFFCLKVYWLAFFLH